MNRLARGIAGYMLAAVLALLPALCVAGVDYSINYMAIPGEMVWAERQAGTNGWSTGVPVYEAFNERVRLGSVGFRIGVGLPAELGPFVAGVETGFNLPAGSQIFEHDQMFKAGPGVTAFTKNDTHEGDLTTWDLTAVPLLIRLRYAPATDSIALACQVGVGPMLIARNMEFTETTYDAVSGMVNGRTTRRSQNLYLPFVVDLSGGIVIPMAEALSLNIFGGLIWLSEVRDTETDNLSSPIVVYGESPTRPALNFGGIGYSVRIGFLLQP